MKKVLLLGMIALLSAGSLLAQHPQQRGQRRQFSAKDRVEKLQKELNLSEEQTTEITVLFSEFENKMKNSGRSDRQQMRAQMDSLNRGVENIPSFEQKDVYRKMLEESRQRQCGGNHGGHRGGTNR